MKKLIRLKPLNPFFFGTDKTFSDDTLHDVVSSCFPQQTHLLGMLRYFLLDSHDLLKLKKRGRWVSNNDFKKAFPLVGGFNKKDTDQKEESLGKIKSLSPVFIVSSDKDNNIKDFHFVAPKDTGLHIEAFDNENIIQIANQKKSKQYRIKNYNPKMGIVNALTTSLFWTNYMANKISNRDYNDKITSEYLHRLNLLSFTDVFKEVKQVGIKRDPHTKTVQADDEGSFYNKTSYIFTEKYYEFAFIVEGDIDFKVDEAFVYLGAERSVFKLTVEMYDNTPLEAYYPKITEPLDKYIALSDVEVADFSTIEFMLNDGYIAHANMARTRKIRAKATGKHNKTPQQYFIPKGSVIYFKDNFKVNTLDTTIGYNTFINKKER